MSKNILFFIVIIVLAATCYGSDTGLGTSPFSSGGPFTSSDANAINDAVNTKQDELSEGPFVDGDKTKLDELASSYTDAQIDNLLSNKQNSLSVYTQAEAEDLTDTSEGIMTPQRGGQNAHQVLEDYYGWRNSLSAAPSSGDQWVGMPVLFDGYTAGGSSADPADQHSDSYDGAYWAYCTATGSPGTWVAYLRVPSMVIPKVLVASPTPNIDDPDNWTLSGYGTWKANDAGSASLPAVAIGMRTKITVRGSYVAVIDPDGTEEIFLNEVSCGAGVSIQSEGDGDGEIVVLEYSASGDWDAQGYGWICTP